MSANAKSTSDQRTGIKGFLKRLSLRNKVIVAVVIVFLLFIIYSIPGDRAELRFRQEGVETAQTAYDLATPAVAPVMERVIAYLNDTGVDMSDNRSFTRLSSVMTTFNRTNASPATQFQAVVTFSQNVHLLLDGPDAVAELDTAEFRTLVAEMDTTLSVAFVALMEMNSKIDAYNSYHRRISAKVTSALFDLPTGYTDPVPSTSRLDSESLEESLDQ
jgi:hypothetical protein